jgi:hypothetical protein
MCSGIDNNENKNLRKNFFFLLKDKNLQNFFKNMSKYFKNISKIDKKSISYLK